MTKLQENPTTKIILFLEDEIKRLQVMAKNHGLEEIYELLAVALLSLKDAKTDMDNDDNRSLN